MFYNGWKSDDKITIVLLFVPPGHIVAAIFNAPGCIYDSQVFERERIYTKMENVYDKTRGKVVLDSAFVVQFRDPHSWTAC